MNEHDCRRCERFLECVELCDAVAAMVGEVEHHLRGAMIPASPRTVAILAATGERMTWAEMIGDEITVEDVDALPGLTARQRLALSLTLLENLPSRDLAARMGIAQSTALGHLHAALRKTRRWIEAARARRGSKTRHIGRSANSPKPHGNRRSVVLETTQN